MDGQNWRRLKWIAFVVQEHKLPVEVRGSKTSVLELS